MAISGGDLADYYMQLERRVARLERTSSVANNQSDTSFVGLLAITGLTVASQTVVAYGADFQVYIKFSWNAVSLDSNVQTDDPLKGYYTSWTKDGTNYTAESFTDQTNAVVGPLAQGQTITFRVRAVTQKDTYGAYTSTNVTSTLDNTAPSQPSTPTAVPYLGQVRVFWDGKTVGGGAMPADLVDAEIHMSTSSITFTPTSATLVDVFYPGGGYYTITDLPYGVTHYFRLVAVDKVGNRSPSSTGVSVVPVQAADGDIATVSIGKLIAGTLSADMTVSARIKTGNTGARVELNSSGLQAYNSSNTQTVNIDASTGNASILGTFQTGLSGQRIVIDPTGNGTIWFYPSTGTDAAFINAPSSNTVGANSGNGGGTHSTRAFMTPVFAEVMYMTQATQVQAGGRLYVDNAGSVISSISGGSVILQVASGAQLNLQNGARLDCNSGTTFFTQVASGASLQVGNGVQGTAKAGDNVTFGVTSGASMQVSGADINITDNNFGGNVTVATQGGYGLFGIGSNRYLEFTTSTTLRHGSTQTNYTGTTITNSCTVFKSAGIVGTALAANMYYDSVSWQLYYSTSSRAVKSDVQDADADQLAAEVLKLRPVTYYDKRQYEESGEDPDLCSKQLGLIAEEVSELPLLNDLLVEWYTNQEGELLKPGINYDRGWIALLPVVKKLVQEVEELKARAA